MIDYFALTLGHGLLLLVFVRLVMRDSLDVDPALSELEQAAEERRLEARAKRGQRNRRAAPDRAKGDAQT